MLYIATVKVLIEADSEAEACDAVSESLRPCFKDWTYLGPDIPQSRFTTDECGGLYTSPVELAAEEYKEKYEEGDLAQMTG